MTNHCGAALRFNSTDPKLYRKSQTSPKWIFISPCWRDSSRRIDSRRVGKRLVLEGKSLFPSLVKKISFLRVLGVALGISRRHDLTARKQPGYAEQTVVRFVCERDRVCFATVLARFWDFAMVDNLFRFLCRIIKFLFEKIFACNEIFMIIRFLYFGKKIFG